MDFVHILKLNNSLFLQETLPESFNLAFVKDSAT